VNRVPAAQSAAPSARDRILTTAYELFTRRGIRDVGVDEVVEKAGVAKTTLYRHFPSKDDLVIAFLSEREQIWTVNVLQRQSHDRADDAEGRLLAIFDVFDDWFTHRGDFEACSFIKVLFEMGAEGPVGQACLAHLAAIRTIVTDRARHAGLHDVEDFTLAFNLLMKGSIVCAAEGDTAAARRARPIGAWLIEQHRPT
jgi:AcrR family transcriptional regulator